MSWKPGPDPGNRQASSPGPVTAGDRNKNPSDSEKAKENSVSCFFLKGMENVSLMSACQSKLLEFMLLALSSKMSKE